MFPQHLGDAQGEVGGGDTFRQRTVQVNADHFRNEEGHGLAQHAGFRLDPAHAPTDDAEAVDHRGVGIRADERVGIIDAVFREHALGEELEVDLVDDADAGRHDGESFKRLLTPLEEFVALAVADELDGHVAVQRGLGTGEIDLYRVIDNEIDRNQRLDLFGRSSTGDGSITHGSDIH